MRIKERRGENFDMKIFISPALFLFPFPFPFYRLHAPSHEPCCRLCCSWTCSFLYPHPHYKDPSVPDKVATKQYYIKWKMIFVVINSILKYASMLTLESSKSNWFWSCHARSSSRLMSGCSFPIRSFAPAFPLSHSSRVNVDDSSCFSFHSHFLPLDCQLFLFWLFNFWRSFCEAAWFWIGTYSATARTLELIWQEQVHKENLLNVFC